MKKLSTLIFLINQIRSDQFIPCIATFYDHDIESVDQKTENDYAPSERSVKRILDFASSYEVADTKSVGKVEWLLN